MKWFLFLVLLGGCASPQRANYHEPEPEYRTTNGLESLLASVDQRRDGGKGDPQPAFLPPPKPRRAVRTTHAAAPQNEAPERVEPPKNLDETPHAVEADVGDARAYVVAPGKPPSRWEVRALVERCDRRPTEWARERCMEEGE